MNRLLHEIKIAAKQAPRLYFAPFVGAVMAMKNEVRALRRTSHQPPTQETSNKLPA
jgi:hypothetical protein